jgi:hypothetical protein
MVTVDEVWFDLVRKFERHLADCNGVEHGQSS